MSLKVNFLVILLGVAPFFALSQNVVIPENVARFFLEQHDRAIILTKKDSVSTKEIINLNLLVKLKDSTIFRYKSDSVVYRGIITTENEINRSLEIANKNLTKRINVLSFKNSLTMGAAVGAVTGSAIPLIGVVAGTAGGIAVGTLVWLVKSITRTHGR